MRCPALSPLATPWPIGPEGVFDPADLGYGKARFIHRTVSNGKNVPPTITQQPVTKRLPKPSKPDADA